MKRYLAQIQNHNKEKRAPCLVPRAAAFTSVSSLLLLLQSCDKPLDYVLIRSLITICTGNLDERVSDRVLYDILIQAGRVVDLHIPRDRETDKPKGYAFAEYETEEIADYAVKLFSGLVTLYNRTLKFAVCTCLPFPSSLSSSSCRPKSCLADHHFCVFNCYSPLHVIVIVEIF